MNHWPNDDEPESQEAPSMQPLAWHVEFENGKVELWPFDDYPDGPPFGETVTALVPLYTPEQIRECSSAEPVEPQDLLTDEAVAQKFHEVYESLAPQFGYATRKESAVPWSAVPEANKELMIATVHAVRAAPTKPVAQGAGKQEPVAVLPCPFCGSSDIDSEEWLDNKGNTGPGCPACGALALSLDAWNRRAAEPKAQEAGKQSKPTERTHAEDCWAWGPAHYKCAMGKVADLKQLLYALNARAAPVAQGAGKPVSGWKLVPAEPTIDMSIAFAESFYTKPRYIDDHDISDWYSAMLAAAPAEPPRAPEAQGELSPLPIEIVDAEWEYACETFKMGSFKKAGGMQIHHMFALRIEKLIAERMELAAALSAPAGEPEPLLYEDEAPPGSEGSACIAFDAATAAGNTYDFESYVAGYIEASAELYTRAPAVEPQEPLTDDAQDAQRYRWLRSIGQAQLNVMAHYAGPELDGKVDAAIALVAPAGEPQEAGKQEPVAWAVTHEDGEIGFYFSGCILWPTKKQAEECSRTHLGSGPAMPLYAAPAPEAQKLSCGHPASLLISSVESDYRFCELCEVYSRRNDAEKHAADLLAERDSLRTQLAAALAVSEAQGELPAFNDVRVQIVYDLLCASDMPPNPEEHWEGYLARRIVAALAAPAREPLSDEAIAQKFHEAYESLAPQFGYATRQESAVTWSAVPEANKQLMIATVQAVRAALAAPAGEPLTDTERLNWLEQQTVDISICERGQHGGHPANWLIAIDRPEKQDRQGRWYDEYEGASLREAIDAARAALEQKP